MRRAQTQPEGPGQSVCVDLLLSEKLCAQTCRFVVVLDCKSLEVALSSVTHEFGVELGAVSKSGHVLCVDVGTHHIADGVVPAGQQVTSPRHTEVFSKHAGICIETEEPLGVACLHVENLDVGSVNCRLLLRDEAGNFEADRNVGLILRDRQIIDDHVRVGGVIVSGGRHFLEVSLEAVAAKEELADVCANIVLQDKFAAWVHTDKFLQIEDPVVEKDVLGTPGDFVFKFLSTHAPQIFVGLEGNWARQAKLVNNLQNGNRPKEKDHIRNDEPDALRLVIEADHSAPVDASDNSQLHSENDKVAKVLVN